MRRTVESVNARWGNLRAILAGDFLLARASEIAASLGTEVAGLLARTIGRLCEGQIAELRHAYDPSRPVDAYVDSIGGKTASLFSAACRIGGIVAERPRPEIEALTAFGHAYGMVFQVADDVLDLTATEEELGKPAGHDLVEGVYTLPVILTLAAGGTAADELGDLLGKPLDGAELDKALAIVRSNGGVAQAIAVAQGYVEQAERALDPLPPSPARDVLAAGAAHLLASLARRTLVGRGAETVERGGGRRCSADRLPASVEEGSRRSEAGERCAFDAWAGEGVAGQDERHVGVLDHVARVGPDLPRGGEAPPLQLRLDDLGAAEPGTGCPEQLGVRLVRRPLPPVTRPVGRGVERHGRHRGHALGLVVGEEGERRVG